MTFFIVFGDILSLQDVKNNLSRYTGPGEGVGGPRLSHQMTHGGGGVKKRPKESHVLFEWPLR